ncbi:MAG: hypothetical protein WC006_00820 [Bacilli bacterium]
MIFNVMNLRYANHDDIKNMLIDCKNHLENLGVAGIVEYHPADQTQNSDHVHLWINTEDTDISRNFGNFLVHNGYSNNEDVFIKAMKENIQIEVDEYERLSNISVKEKLHETNLTNENIVELKSEIFKKLNSIPIQGDKIDRNNEHEQNENATFDKERDRRKQIPLFDNIADGERSRTKSTTISEISKIDDLPKLSKRDLDKTSKKYILLLPTDERNNMGFGRGRVESQSDRDLRRQRESHGYARSGRSDEEQQLKEYLMFLLNEQSDEYKKSKEELEKSIDRFLTGKSIVDDEEIKSTIEKTGDDKLIESFEQMKMQRQKFLNRQR